MKGKEIAMKESGGSRMDSKISVRKSAMKKSRDSRIDSKTSESKIGWPKRPTGRQIPPLMEKARPAVIWFYLEYRKNKFNGELPDPDHFNPIQFRKEVYALWNSMTAAEKAPFLEKERKGEESYKKDMKRYLDRKHVAEMDLQRSLDGLKIDL